MSPLATAAVEVHDVVKRYRNGLGVGPVRFAARRGECVGLMGPNGAGKSTLLRLVATRERPDRGEIVRLGTGRAGPARRHLGYAPDVIVEEGMLTARQAAFFWCSQWMPRAEVPRLVDEALTAFGLASVSRERVAAFSFGMRRRLGLVEALAHRPAIALLDEPTAGLDPAGCDALRRLLQRRGHAGQSTLLASTDCAFVAQSCDRVVFLDEGRVVRDATPAELLREGGAARRADLEVGAGCDLRALERIAGVGAVSRRDGVVSVTLLDDRVLGQVVAAVDAGSGLRSVRLHVPDLSDAFRALTGRSLGVLASGLRERMREP